MARRKTRSKKFGFDSKTVIDVGIAGLTTRIIPQLLNAFMPLDPTLYSVAGAGGTFLVGSLMKKPVLANAGIALGLVELVAPMVENVIGEITGGVAPGKVSPVGVTGAPVPVMVKQLPKAKVELADYQRLQALADYTNSPMVLDNSAYRTSY